jgi:hypothetical protein
MRCSQGGGDARPRHTALLAPPNRARLQASAAERVARLETELLEEVLHAARVLAAVQVAGNNNDTQ